MRLPEPGPVPTVESETVLLIDKAHGQMTRWPLLPDADLVVQYRYLRGDPMTLDMPSA